MRGSAEPFVDLAGCLDGQRQARHVEDRAIAGIPRLRIERRLAPAADGADDHRGVRPSENDRRDVDDVRHRHGGAARDREVHFESRGERREQDEEDERKDRRKRRARQEQDQRQRPGDDHHPDVPACGDREIPEQGEPGRD